MIRDHRGTDYRDPVVNPSDQHPTEPSREETPPVPGPEALPGAPADGSDALVRDPVPPPADPSADPSADLPVDSPDGAPPAGPRSPVSPAEPAEPAPSAATEAVIPAVVVVMVAHNPGAWFEETLASVAGQDYLNASLLVIDSGSDTDLEARIAAAAPAAHLRRIETNAGFGPAANEVLEAVEGAAFYLFCHDDVRLEPDVIQVMVEEAFRSNAGVIGPKLVEWDDPGRILQVGMGADKTGAPSPYVERGELDQEQHDAVRDVFYVPGAVTLVRADLFRALGGFDPGIELLGEDLDLSWRAHVAGARVLVAPAARVAHLEALGERRPIDDRRRLQMRHRLRTSRVCYSFGSRLRVMPQAFVIALFELVLSVLQGRFHQTADVASAWMWNARRRGEVRSRRHDLAGHRAVPDQDIRRLQVRGSARMSAFLRGQIGSGEDRLGSVTGAGRSLVTNLRSATMRSSIVAWALVIVLLLVGSRQLITDGIPAIGDFAAFPTHPSTLMHEWMSGYRDIGLGSVSPAPTLLAGIGLLGYVFFGAMSLLRTVLILGALPIGVIGIWRMARPLGSRRARIVSLLVYACVPIGFNAVAQGRWTGLVMYGLAPWMMNHLLKGSRLAPFGSVGGDPGPGVSERPILQRILLLGVVTAMAAMLVPFALVVVPAIAVAFVLGSLLVGEVRGSGRVLAVAAGGTLTAFVLHLPWSASLLTGGWQAFVGTSSDGGRPLALGAIFRFETGPFGAPPIGWVFLPIGVLALLIGRRWRFSWAARSWMVILAGVGLVFVGAEGWLPGSLPVPEVLLAPAAAALALSAGLGMAAFEVDLPDYHFGWRQIASLLAGAALVLALLPAIAAASSGRWGMPTGDFERPVRNLNGKNAVDQPYRVLWLGDADLLPAAGWPLDAPSIDQMGDGTLLSYATSNNGMPDVSDVIAGSDSGATSHLDEALQYAAQGGTSRLGAMLAPMGVRYIVVPEANAPSPLETGPTVVPQALLTLLDAQLDLSNLDVAGGVVVYRNAAWGPTRAMLPADTAYPSGDESPVARTIPGLTDAATALPDDKGYESFAGSIDQDSSVYLAEAASGRWHLEVDGNQVDGHEVLGWSNAFDAPSGQTATLAFDTPITRLLMIIGQAILWLAVLVYLFRTRVRIESARDLAELRVDGELA